MTLEYATAAQALAEAGWIDPFFGDLVALPVEDAENVTGGPSSAQAYWNEIRYAGELGIDALALAETADPNRIVLRNKLSGSFRSEAGTPLLTYFFQHAQCSVEGLFHIDEFPPGTPCSLHFEATWPQDTWTGDYLWRFEAASNVGRVECGWDPNGPYGPRAASITVFAGEPVYVFLASLGEGLNEIGGRNGLGVGTIQLDLGLTVTRHIADLKPDGFVNFKDFAVFAEQWSRSDPNAAETGQYDPADLDCDSRVAGRDLLYFSRSWLLCPRPPASKEESPQDTP